VTSGLDGPAATLHFACSAGAPGNGNAPDVGPGVAWPKQPVALAMIATLARHADLHPIAPISSA
jgi:hypothetical protein